MDRQDFVRSIVASPKDVGLRLVYADWLDGRGFHDEAAFVRTPGRAKVACPGGQWYVGPEGEPGSAFSDDWLQRARSILLDFPHSWRLDVVASFLHGFIEQLTCSAHDWTTHVKACAEGGIPNLALAQPIREVWLGDRRPRKLAQAGRLFDSYAWRDARLAPEAYGDLLPGDNGRSLIHAELFRLLASPDGVYPTAMAADVDLGEAALHLARGTRPRAARPASGRRRIG